MYLNKCKISNPQTMAELWDHFWLLALAEFQARACGAYIIGSDAEEGVDVMSGSNAGVDDVVGAVVLMATNGLAVQPAIKKITTSK